VRFFVKVLIAVNSLQQGGAERSSVKLAQSLAEDGHHVIFVTWKGGQDFYEVSEIVRRINMISYERQQSDEITIQSYLRQIFGIFSKLLTFRRICKSEKIDLFIGFEGYTGSILATTLIGARIPSIVSERISPDSKVHPTPKIAQILRPFIYHHGALCSVQTLGILSLVKEMWNIQAYVTPNHLEEVWFKEAPVTHRSKSVLALGRFDQQKGYETLLKAWSIVEQRHPDWWLQIYGRGDITQYYHLSQDLEIKNIKFFPPTKDSMGELRACGIFVSASNYEGFPNVVLEALSSGAPTVSTLSTDVISDFAEKGSLISVPIKHPVELANAIIELISSGEKRRNLSKVSRNVAREFDWNHIRRYWQIIIDDALQTKGITFKKIKS
jgi:GalNAc-alpha-(1->4)-GalNAc-alpha-(1->3)-diNAcBac-PP-undecaprenol alpha-1,4-N-acetyl-D-galactosaminyltransferase